MSDALTPEQARQMVAADEQRRAQAAAEAIQAVLAEHGCTLLAVPQIAADGRVVAVVQIAPRQE